jgi:hypothetical protein
LQPKAHAHNSQLRRVEDAVSPHLTVFLNVRLGATDYLDRFWESAHLETASQERLWAVGALQLGGERERDYLVSLLEDANPDVYRAAVFALEKLGDPRALDAVTRALRRHRRLIRSATTRSTEAPTSTPEKASLRPALLSCTNAMVRNAGLRECSRVTADLARI